MPEHRPRAVGPPAFFTFLTVLSCSQDYYSPKFKQCLYVLVFVILLFITYCETSAMSASSEICISPELCSQWGCIDKPSWGDWWLEGQQVSVNMFKKTPVLHQEGSQSQSQSQRWVAWQVFSCCCASVSRPLCFTHLLLTLTTVCSVITCEVSHCISVEEEVPSTSCFRSEEVETKRGSYAGSDT